MPLEHKSFKIKKFEKPKVLFLCLVTSLNNVIVPLPRCCINKPNFQTTLVVTHFWVLPRISSIYTLETSVFLLLICLCQSNFTGPQPETFESKKKKIFFRPLHISSKEHFYYTIIVP